MVINSPCLNSKKELAIPEQTATESRRKTHYNLRQTLASEERIKIRMMESVSIDKWLTDSRRPSLNEDMNILARTSLAKQ
ncbi:hypothetical protein Tco_0752123 [Tanacetum coccineum]|uniref:Uncharacterized protein n=1 Tax=Tanacetum coccineum TaxID=301880 RepID=A0ABQ4Z8Q8_9ASTR